MATFYGDSPRPSVGEHLKFKVALSYGRFTMEGPVTEVFANGNFEIRERTTGNLVLIDRKTVLYRRLQP